MEAMEHLFNSTPQAIEPTVPAIQLISDADFILVASAILGAGLIVSLPGIAANAINVKTFLRMGIEDGVTSLFLAISCSDFLFEVLASVRNATCLMNLYERGTGRWHFVLDPLAVAYFSDNSALVLYATTTLTSAFLALARCACVARPLHFRHTFTRGRCVAASVLCFLFPAAFQAAVFVNMGTTHRPHLGHNASRLSLWMSGDRERVKDLVRLILSFVLPIATQVVAVGCLVVMTVKLREAAHFRSGMENDGAGKETTRTRLSAKDRQVVKQVFLIVLIYATLNVQKIADSILTSLDSRLDYGKPFRNTYDLMAHLGIVFQALNAALNVFVYYSYNAKFRSMCFTTSKKP